MASIPCPTGDKGICSIPSHTLVVRAHEVMVRSRAEVESAFPAIDLDHAELVPVGLHSSIPDLGAMFRADEVDRSALERFAGTVGEELAKAVHHDANHEATKVLVYCTPCGHIFKVEV